MKQPIDTHSDCRGCGNPKPAYVTTCPRCGADKCDKCDMGNDVECGSCYSDDDGYDDEEEWDAAV